MTDAWHWPQYLTISFAVFSAVCFAVLDGKPRTGNYQAALSIVLIAGYQWVLWMGGFYS